MREKTAQAALSDLNELIPDAIAVAKLADKPEGVFVELRDMAPSERPGVLCLEARNASEGAIQDWLARFDALVYEQENSSQSSSVELQIVVFLGAKQTLEPFDELLSRPDIDWVLTDDRTSPINNLYQAFIRQDLATLLSTDPAHGLELVDDSDARPLEDFLPEDERDSWKQRLRDLEQR